MVANKPIKKTLPKATTNTTTKKNAPKSSKNSAIAATAAISSEQLVVENLSTLSSLVGSLSETLDVLVQKVENMAYHIIATEEVLSEVVTSTGLDIVRVNTRIRTKIANGTDKQGDPSRSIDIAAGIASPMPKFKK